MTCCIANGAECETRSPCNGGGPSGHPLARACRVQEQAFGSPGAALLWCACPMGQFSSGQAGPYCRRGQDYQRAPPQGVGGRGGGRAQTTPLPLPYIALPPTQTVLDLRCNGPYVVKSKFAVHIITSAVLTYIIARQQVATSAHSHAQYDSALQGHALG